MKAYCTPLYPLITATILDTDIMAMADNVNIFIIYEIVTLARLNFLKRCCTNLSITYKLWAADKAICILNSIFNLF